MNQTIENNQNDRQMVISLLKELIAKKFPLKGETYDVLTRMLSMVTIDDTLLPDTVGSESILRSPTINTLLNRFYLDAAIHYLSLYKIYDDTSTIQQLFGRHILSYLARCDEMLEKAQSYKELWESTDPETTFKYSYQSLFDTSSLNENSQLRVNKSARCYSLPGIEAEYATKNSCSLSIILLSDEASIIVENNPQSAFSQSLLDPYYVIINSHSNPANKYFYTESFSDEKGIIVSFKISFPSVIPISRIRFTPFSSASITVKGVYISEVSDMDWDSYIFTKVHGESEQTAHGFDLIFSRVFAKEVHIVVKQEHYTTVSDSVQYSLTTVQDYIHMLQNVLTTIRPEGYNSSSIQAQLNEFIIAVRDSIKPQSVTISSGSRLYTLGIGNISVCDESYSSFGSHYTKLFFQGIPRRVGIRAIGNIDDEDFIILGKTLLGATTKTLLPIDQSGTYIRDCCTIGIQSQDTSSLVFDTHFFVDQNYPITLRTNGEEVVIEPTPGIVCYKEESSELHIPNDLVSSLILSPGSPLGIEYTRCSQRPDGGYYNPSVETYTSLSNDVTVSSTVFKKPQSRYLYVPETSSGEVCYIAYNETEYRSGILNDTINGYILTTKGYEFGSQFVPIGSGECFVSRNDVIGPIDGVYHAIIDEPITLGDINDDDDIFTYYNVTLQYPYACGTVKAHAGDYIITVRDYQPDTSEHLLTNDEKRQVSIGIQKALEINSIERPNVKVSYTPLSTIPIEESVSTIKPYTRTEEFTLDNEQSVVLSSFPLVDERIVLSAATNGEFIMSSDNIFYLSRFPSVVYDPVSVKVNNVKARNTSSYISSSESQAAQSIAIPGFHCDENDRRIIYFDRPIIGTVIVQYYAVEPSILFGIECYHTNFYRDSETPLVKRYELCYDTVE